MLDAWNDPAQRHAMLVHFPIVLTLLGAVLALCLMIFDHRLRSLRLTCGAVLLAATAGAWMAGESGEDALDRQAALRGEPLSQVAHDKLERHESLGEWVWAPLAAATVCVVISAVSGRTVRMSMQILALLLTLGATALTATTAHLGGELVYRHGVGVPATGDNVPGPATDA